MNNKLQQKLKSLNLIADKKSHDQGYAWHPDARNDFDLARFLNNQTYWKITDGEKEFFNKKIVLNDYRLLFWGRNEFYTVLAFLVRHGFSLYLRTAPGKFEVINNVDSLSSKNIDKIQLTDKEDIFNELNAIEEKPEDFYILDHTNDADLLKNFASFVGLVKYDAQIKSLDKMLAYKGIFLSDRYARLLTNNNIDYLSALGSQGIFTFFRVNKLHLIDYRNEENNDSQQIYLKWRTTPNKDENKKLLTEIKNAIDPDLKELGSILPYQAASDVYYADDDITDLNLNDFKSINYLKIFASKNLVNIHGFYDQKQLKKLLLQLKNDVSYSFARFPLLKSLNIIVSPKHHLKQMLENSTLEKIELSFTKFDPDLSGLSTAKELSDITLHLNDQKKPITLDISALARLKKLNLSVSSYIHSNDNKYISMCLPVRVVSDVECPLEELKISTNTSETKVSYDFLTSLPHLRRLKLFETDGLDLNDLFKRCPNLEELDLTQLRNLKELDLSTLKKLKKVKIYLCSALEKITGLDQCQQLKDLEIASNGQMEGLDLSSNSEIESIDLSLNNVSIPIVLPDRPQSIKKLRIRSKMDVLDLTNFSNLKKLTLLRCEIKDIKNLADCANLQEVYMSETKNLESIDFSGNKNITELEIEDDHIKYINASALTHLEKIRVRSTFFGKLDCDLYLPPAFDEKALDTCDIKTQKLVLQHYREGDSDNGFRSENDTKERNPKKIPITHIDAPLLEKQKLKLREQEQQRQLYGYYNSNNISLPHYSGYFSKYENPNELVMNANTYTSPDDTFHANELFSDSVSTPHVSHYRTTIYDHFEYNKFTGLKIKQADFKSHLKIYTPKNDQRSLFKNPTATIKDHFIPGKYYCLPGISSADVLTKFSNPEIFDIFQCDLTNQFYIKLKEQIEDFDGAIQYTIDPDDNYFAFSPADRLASQIAVPKLPDLFKNSLAELFAKNKTLKALSQLTSNEAKVRALIEYCNFKNESLSDDFNDPFSNNEDLISLIKMIDEQKGKCDQRSFAFMALCHYLNIPARMIGNDCHAFVEVPVSTSGKVKWCGIELGGTEGKLKIIKKPETLPPWLDLNNNIQHDNSFTAKVTDQLTPIDETYLSYILPNQNYLDDCKTFNQALDKLLLQPKAVLFRTNREDVLSYYQGLYQYYQEKNLPMVFINSVEDLKVLFEPIKIYDTKEGKDVLYSHVDGPIKQMLQNKCGAIFINWNNFSEHDKAIYKCLIEDSPSYDNFPIPKAVRVFGILQEGKHANDVFLTRNLSINLAKSVEPPNTCNDSAIEVSSDMEVGKSSISTVHSNSKPTPLQLYRGRDWKSLLLNDYITKGDVMHVHKGALLKALKNGESITLINPPDDHEFKLIIERIKTEGRLYVNGEWVSQKPGFHLQLEEQAIELKVPGRMIIDNDSETKGKKYYLNSSNFDSLFKQYHVDEASRIYVMAGWLKEITSQDKVIVTSTLKDEQWQKLFDGINTLKLNHDIHFHFTEGFIPAFYSQHLEEKKASLPSTTTPQYSLAQLKERLLSDNHLHVETNDPAFIADQFKKQCGLTSENIFYATSENSWSDFIEQVNKPEIINHRLRAKRTEGPVLEKLKKGETVILCGNLSSQDYANLQTLFCNTPYLQVNGHREELPGRLVLISNKLNKDSNKLHESYAIHSNMDDYEKALRQEIKDLNEAKLLKLNRYFKYLRLAIPDSHDPTPEQYTYAKFKQIYLAINQPNNLENPLKFVNQYYYQKNTEHYAFLNVLAKVLLSQTSHDDIRATKIKVLLNNVQSEADFEHKFWQLFNCLNTKRFAQLFVDDKFLLDNAKNPSSRPSTELRDAVLLNLCQLFPNLLQQAWIKERITNENINTLANDPIKSPIDRFKKQKQQLLDAINDSNKSLIYLLGNSGTGKTFTVKKLSKKLSHVNFYASEKNILDWLKPSADGKIKLLLLDEANLSPAFHWEFLRGLKQNHPVVYFDGKPYPLSEKHKIIFTGNPLNYPGRQFQPIVWDHAHVIWFSKFSQEFLSKKINKFFTKLNFTLSQKNQLQDITDRVYDAYRYLEGSDQRIAEITIRDIENICARFLLLQEKHSLNASKTNLSQAIYTEMNGILLNSAARQNFKAFLQKKCANLPPTIPSHYADDEFIVPPKKEKIWQLINEDLELREMRIRYESNNIGKLGVLIEGPSGIGKTKFFVKALEHKGYHCANNLNSDISSDKQHIYYHLMAGSKNNREILLKAFHQGAIVIFDELNLEPELEDLLNQLLSGKDPEDHEAKQPGFMILASQNPAFYDGCTTLSRAQINRLHRINMQDYKESDLVYIADKMKISKPQIFVNTFFYSEKNNPDEVNTRNCFHAMNMIRRNRTMH